MKTKVSGRKRQRGKEKTKAKRIEVGSDIYEEWLKRQTVHSIASKPEVQVPLASYEAWIRKEVRERLKS